jgi:hypothetical protein
LNARRCGDRYGFTASREQMTLIVLVVLGALDGGSVTATLGNVSGGKPLSGMLDSAVLEAPTMRNQQKMQARRDLSHEQHARGERAENGEQVSRSVRVPCAHGESRAIHVGN